MQFWGLTLSIIIGSSSGGYPGYITYSSKFTIMEKKGTNVLQHCGSVAIDTERLELRRFCVENVGDMLANWIGDPEVQSLIAEPVYSTTVEATELVMQYVEQYKRLDYYRWAIVVKETGECIGQIAFFLIDDKNRFGEIEYCIGSKHQGNGFATECTKALIAFGFDRINLNKIQISHMGNNMASKRVIEKCNFTYEGTLREFFFSDGEYIDRLYYSILKREFLASSEVVAEG